MLRTLVNHSAVGPLVVITIAATIGVVLLGVWLVRRWVPATREGFDAEVSSQILGVVAALFGLLLAFVIVIEYQNFGSAQDNVGQEADSLAAIGRDSNAFPPAQGVLVRRAIGRYLREVVNTEWPAMRLGHQNTQGATEVNEIYAAFQKVRPRSPEQTAFYNDSVRQLNDMLIARRNRLSASGGGLPSLVLTLLLVGSVVILGYVMVVGSRSFWFHAIGACSISLVVVLSFVVLVDLSFPFSGSLNVSTAPYKTGELAVLFHQ